MEDPKLTPSAFTTGEGEQLGETPGSLSRDCRPSQRPHQTAGGAAGPAGESGGQSSFGDFPVWIIAVIVN